MGGLSSDPTQVGTEELVRLLRVQAGGYPPGEAAVELLAGHDMWLRRADFIRGFVWLKDAPDLVGDAGPMAGIEWKGALAALDAGRLPGAASSAEKVLRIAAALATDAPVELRNCLTGLGAASAELVARAVLRAAGHESVTVEVARPVLPDFLAEA